jgi:hypothetical protein
MKTEADQIVEFLLRHKKFAFDAICRSYPFDEQELDKYSSLLNWRYVSMNCNINWNQYLFKKFEDKIDINALSYCNSFPWTEEFIDNNIADLFYDISSEGEIEKTCFASNIGLPWSDEFIAKYAEHLDWMWLSMNESISFTIELIDKYADKWDFDSLEFNSQIVNNPTLKSYLNIFYNRAVQENFHKCEFCFKGDEIIEEYWHKSISEEFCFCPNFKWSDKFASKMRSKITNCNSLKRIASNIRSRKFEHWSIDVLDAFEEYWDYKVLYLCDEVNDYLGFGLKDCGRLEEVMREL